MVESLRPDIPKSSIGTYSGAIESLFGIAQLLTAFYWGALSDRVGRKPVILGGLAALSLSIFLFGLAKTFLWALLTRALCKSL
jgi:MFS family permease